MLHSDLIFGYSCFSFFRASSMENCHSTARCFLLVALAQALT